ncbi:MAG: TetR/AcrR family transcriptional regulator [Blautia sp.]
MSEKTRKQDRRTRYTRQTIKDTFLELLNQKSFTKITVTEICKNAEINRGTFYLHYYDIHDVLSDIFNDMTQDMLTTVDHLFCLNQKKLFLSVLSENTDGITIQGTVSG